MHYARWAKHGDLDWQRQRHFCTIPGCDRPASSYGLCSMHAKRRRTHGDPLVRKRAASGELIQWLHDHASYDGPDCLIFPFGRAGTGYGVVTTQNGKTGAHREMCRLAHGEPPTAKHIAIHSCGRGHEGCVNPAHLNWALHAENTNDMWRHGTMVAGSRHPGAKLTEEDVLAIRRMAHTASESEIAALFGISHPHAHRIIARQRWKWLP